MNILVTGGFGNIGVCVVNECLRRGHRVSVFEVRTKRTQRHARRYRKRGVEVFFGDLRNAGDVAAAVVDQDAVIHLAAILPPLSDRKPELCKAVNVGGTGNLIKAVRACPKNAVLVEVSSASVMGPTQSRVPPVRPEAPLAPIDAYSRSKIEAESLVASSGARYCILRLAAVMPTSVVLGYLLGMVDVIFDMPLEARCEVVMDIDVAYALVSAAEDLAASGKMSGRAGFIAGGKAQDCQIRIREMLEGAFTPMGLGMPDESLFSQNLQSYYLDWYDTDETQAILKYQRHSRSEWAETMKRNNRFLRPFVRALGPFIMRWLSKKSSRNRG